MKSGGKPVIVFGLSWIEDFDGVLRIRNNQDVDKIMQFIESYHFDQHKLDCYLKAFDLATVHAYHYPGKILGFNMDEEVCVNNLVNSISAQIN